MTRLNNKAPAVICCVCAALLAMGAGGAYAFLTSRDDASNQLTIGQNVIKIEEEFTPPATVAPGASIPKKVRVANTGNASCFVRALAEVSDGALAGVVSLNVNTQAWTTKQPDGYYYCKTPVGAGQTTPELFTTVSISSKAASSDLAPFDVIVRAESAQAASAAGTAYSTPQEAFAALEQKGA